MRSIILLSPCTSHGKTDPISQSFLIHSHRLAIRNFNNASHLRARSYRFRVSYVTRILLGEEMSTMNYKPTILIRMGERQALEALEPEYHDRFIPIFLVAPRVWDYDTGAYQKTTLHHLQKLPADLLKARGQRMAFIDARHLDEPDTILDGRHALLWLVDETAKLGQTLVPVVNPQSSVATVRAAASIAKSHGYGAAVRLPLKSSTSLVSAEFSQLITELKLDVADVDLIFDLGANIASELASKAVLPDVIEAVSAGPWRSMTVAGAAFPNETPAGRGVHEIARADWATVNDVNATLRNRGFREVDFSDYVISSDTPGLDIDPKLLTISATIRYTNGNNWLFARGDLYKASGGRGLGGDAMRGTINALRNHSDYREFPNSKIHDWFDGVINRTQSGGNPTVWRRWATYHHIRSVLDQLSN